MTIRTRTPLTVLLSAITVATGLAATPQRAVVSGAHDAPLTATVPVDPRITVGTLANGLRYYIRVNEQPKNRAELRLVVNAGSVLEDDDQRGLAHFVEHMAFNGTEELPQAGGDRVPAVDRHALRRAHQRQHELRPDGLQAARFRPTVPRVIDRSLLILEDWAHDVSFEPAEIDKERGVILEEWRTRPRRRRADPRRSSCRCCSRIRATPSGCRSASQRSSAPSPHDRLKQFYTRLVSARPHGGDCRR